MRNTGWYIPYWRKPKKKGRSPASGDESVARTEEQLEGVRQRWIERYRRTVRALAVFGLSVGSNRSEVQARYERLRGTGVVPERELEDAYRYLLRVLPPVERRRKRPSPSSGNRGDQSEAATQSAQGADATVVVEETAVLVAVEVTAEADVSSDDEDDGDGDYEDEEADAAHGG